VRETPTVKTRLESAKLVLIALLAGGLWLVKDLWLGTVHPAAELDLSLVKRSARPSQEDSKKSEKLDDVVFKLSFKIVRGQLTFSESDVKAATFEGKPLSVTCAGLGEYLNHPTPAGDSLSVGCLVEAPRESCINVVARFIGHRFSFSGDSHWMTSGVSCPE
jgi:hypothetical protein